MSSKKGKRSGGAVPTEHAYDAAMRFRKANTFGDFMINNVNMIVLALAGTVAAVLKTVGLANQARPPAFSVAFWFDDLFSGSALFALALLAWGCRSVRAPAVRKALLTALTGLVAVAAAFSLPQLQPAAALGLLAAANAYALTTYTADAAPTATAAISGTNSSGRSGGAAETALAEPAALRPARLALLVDAAVLAAAAATRLAFGIEELAALPAQAQVRFALPLAAGLAALLGWAAAHKDVHVLRTAVWIGGFFALCASGFMSDGSTKVSFLSEAVRWAARAVFGAHVYCYLQAPLGSAVAAGYRRLRDSTVKLGGMESMGID